MTGFLWNLLESGERDLGACSGKETAGLASKGASAVESCNEQIDLRNNGKKTFWDRGAVQCLRHLRASLCC